MFAATDFEISRCTNDDIPLSINNQYNQSLSLHSWHGAAYISVFAQWLG